MMHFCNRDLQRKERADRRALARAARHAAAEVVKTGRHLPRHDDVDVDEIRGERLKLTAEDLRDDAEDAAQERGELIDEEVQKKVHELKEQDEQQLRERVRSDEEQAQSQESLVAGASFLKKEAISPEAPAAITRTTTFFPFILAASAPTGSGSLSQPLCAALGLLSFASLTVVALARSARQMPREPALLG